MTRRSKEMFKRCKHPVEELEFVRRATAGEKYEQTNLSPDFARCRLCGRVIDTNFHWPGESGKVLSVDAETDGLYGLTFAIGVTVRWLGRETARFVGHCPYEGTNDWVIANVLPSLEQLPVNYTSSEELEEAFWAFWFKHGKSALIVAHCAIPVESGLFRRCVERDLKAREWSGPYPAIHDVASLLALLGEPADSVDAYASKWQLEVPQGQVHDPFYDAVVSALVFEHAWRRLMSK